MKGYMKRIAAFALAAGMVFSTVPYSFVSSVAADTTTAEEGAETHIWDGTSDVSWYDDEDIEFHISTPEQLAGLAELVNTGKTMAGKTFVLDNDLQMNDVSTYDEWETTPPENAFTSIGSFSGSFIGNNHTISGLYGVHGMFREITNSCISELNLVDLYINSNWKLIGGIVNSATDSTISSCTVQGIIKSTRDNGYIGVGGIIGEIDTVKIINCNSAVDIFYSSTGSVVRMGGICGFAGRASIVVNYHVQVNPLAIE